MPTCEIRPWRLATLLGTVLLLTAYVPHPHLSQPLPQSLTQWMNVWANGSSSDSD
ncbi:MAG TPA: hypothetical protein V6D02_12755 [Candidatus Obscuribacterales bacterium]